jgi:cell division septation protein DedD
MAAVLVGAVVTGGGLAYVYKSNGPGDGSPSVIAADTRPVKEEPQEPGGRDFPNGNKLIYDRLGGAAQEGDGGGARLASGGPSERSAPGVITTGGTLEERIENALKAQRDEEPTGSNRKAGSPDAPRTVRTVTYGPDGTQQAIEPKTQRIAANTSADVSSGIVVTTTPTSSDSGLGSQDSDTEAEAQAPKAAPARPARVAAVAPPAAVPQVSESAGGSGNFFVQIAARNDQDAAMQAFASLQQKYAGALGNHSPSVRKVDLGEKGVWYRLLVGPVETKAEADQLCEQLKVAGMKSCFARKD